MLTKPCFDLPAYKWKCCETIRVQLVEAEFYAESQPPFLGSPCGLVLVSSLCKHVLAASNSEATVKRLCKLMARRNLPWVTLTLTHLLRSHVVRSSTCWCCGRCAAGRPFGRFESSATGAEAAVGASNPRGEEPGHRLVAIRHGIMSCLDFPSTTVIHSCRQLWPFTSYKYL